MLPILYTRGISQIDRLKHRLGCSGGIWVVQQGCGGRATESNSPSTSSSLVMWRRRKRRVDKTKRGLESGISIVSSSGYPTKSPVRKRSDRGKLGVVSTPIYNRRHNSRRTMSRHASGAAAAGRKPRKYGAKYLFGHDLTTSGEEVTSADDHVSNASRVGSPDRASNLNRVKSMEGGRTKSRERHDSSGSHGGHKYHVKRHDSRERHKPSRRISIDPKLRNQIIEEAVRKARERQLSRQKETSKSKSHGAKVERSDAVQVKRKSSASDHKSKEDKGKHKDRKSPLGRHNVSHESPLVSRDRTPDDIEEWLKWRCYLNHQLSMYIVKGNSSRTQVPVDIMSVPEKLNKYTRSAIWSHAQKERPKTSLDSNAYIVYGIPRARLRPNGPNFQISHYAVPVKGKNNQEPKRPTSPVQDQGAKSGQPSRTYMSPRDCAQEHGLAEKRPLSPKQQQRPTPPKVVDRPPSLSHVSKEAQIRNERPLSPTRLSHHLGNYEDSRRPISPNNSNSTKDMRNQNAPLGAANKFTGPTSAAPAEMKLAQPIGAANLREMYKKPFLRTMSDQSFSNMPSSPKRQISDPVVCNQSSGNGSHRPISPLALYSQGIRNDGNTQKEGKMECHRMGQVSPKMIFSSPKTIYAKRPVSLLARTDTDVTAESDVINQLHVTASDNQSKRGYVNVPEELVDYHDCCASPPTPPPLPPKSFHVRK